MTLKPKPEVLMYTDGACSGNPGPGGWGVLLEWNGKSKELSGGEAQTTNNRMEMKAIIEGLKALNKPCKVTICSDSALIINAFKDNWIDGWIKRGWRKADKKPVENQDLWQEMLNETDRHIIIWKKVKGHSTDARNNRVDELAVAESKKFIES
ncbi:MAG TPA: ribonuclease HI [Bacteroidetes bacterium]|nr:ribonuclease HI [Bacteroidota bacterium]